MVDGWYPKLLYRSAPFGRPVYGTVNRFHDTGFKSIGLQGIQAFDGDSPRCAGLVDRGDEVFQEISSLLILNALRIAQYLVYMTNLGRALPRRPQLSQENQP